MISMECQNNKNNHSYEAYNLQSNKKIVQKFTFFRRGKIIDSKKINKYKYKTKNGTYNANNIYRL